MEKPADETRAVARLPNLDIEILHRKRPEEGAEYMSITLRATPSFRAMDEYLNAMGGPMLAMLSPLSWMGMAQAFWQPFLPPVFRDLSLPGVASPPELKPPSESEGNRR